MRCVASCNVAGHSLVLSGRGEQRDDVCIDLMDTDQISLVQSVCLLTGFTVDNGAAMSVSGF